MFGVGVYMAVTVAMVATHIIELRTNERTTAMRETEAARVRQFVEHNTHYSGQCTSIVDHTGVTEVVFIAAKNELSYNRSLAPRRSGTVAWLADQPAIFTCHASKDDRDTVFHRESPNTFPVEHAIAQKAPDADFYATVQTWVIHMHSFIFSVAVMALCVHLLSSVYMAITRAIKARSANNPPAVSTADKPVSNSPPPTMSDFMFDRTQSTTHLTNRYAATDFITTLVAENHSTSEQELAQENGEGGHVD